MALFNKLQGHVEVVVDEHLRQLVKCYQHFTSKKTEFLVNMNNLRDTECFNKSKKKKHFKSVSFLVDKEKKL